MAQNRETTVTHNTPLPEGYAFLPKGNMYKTLHCRRLTHEAGKPVFVVEEGKKVIGIRVPKSVFFQVQTLARETLSDRRAATEQRDATLVRQAAIELDKQFPKISSGEKEMVLKHGFRKLSGRVGRTGTIPMAKKVLFAVIAHIRHEHTDYDQMMDKGINREDARRRIAKDMQGVLRLWGARGGKR
jgi:hypothetical protein